MSAEILAGIDPEADLSLERVPMHLLEEPRRRKVVEALGRSLKLIDESKL
jgi:hypothetical protein